jgi:hypothetical protein
MSRFISNGVFKEAILNGQLEGTLSDEPMDIGHIGPIFIPIDKDITKRSDLIEISASEILDKIEKNEPIEYEKVFVVGAFDINKINLLEKDGYAIINSPISIINSEFAISVKFEDVFFKDEVDFSDTTFWRAVCFTGSKFNKFPQFANAKIYNDGFFDEVQFMIGAGFSGVRFCECAAVFWDTCFDGTANFINSHFEGEAFFEGCWFGEIAEFSGAKFDSNTFFDKSEFKGSAQFGAFIDRKGTLFSGEILSFIDAKFTESKTQEEACRKAKNVLEKNGNREDAGYHFYREMDARRKRKTWYYRYPEYIFIQLIFGYGVYPFRLWLCWFIFVGFFAIIYSLGSGIDAKASGLSGIAQPIDYIWFSIATAVTPGYAGYKPTLDFKLMAGLEAIFGTFMWAAFIATFARKYMR